MAGRQLFSNAERESKCSVQRFCSVNHPVAMVLSFAVPAAAMGTSRKAWDLTEQQQAKETCTKKLQSAAQGAQQAA